ncbi:MAG: molybdenum cofactor guanylyltransferase [Actinomycetota bacterium]|nr:molybdenum cofactor guanylyltransferase [Actinomycetota bacterium]
MPTCLLLAGGKSSRMVADKISLEISGKRLIEIQLDIISEIFDEVLIVGSKKSVPLLKVYEKRGVRVMPESFDGMGPLGGIISGLLSSSTIENFVLACDMPFIRRDVIKYFLENLEGYDVVVPQTHTGLEPLHAVYTKACIAPATEQLKSGNLRVDEFYPKVKVRYIALEELAPFDPSGKFLLNINTPEDLQEAGGIVGNGKHFRRREEEN